MLALMLIIQGIQAIHRHSDPPPHQPAWTRSSNSADSKTIIGSSRHCLICEFQLTRNATADHQFFAITVLVSPAETYTTGPISCESTSEWVLCLRGPPALS